jgi:hypothetical protein
VGMEMHAWPCMDVAHRMDACMATREEMRNGGILLLSKTRNRYLSDAL